MSSFSKMTTCQVIFKYALVWVFVACAEAKYFTKCDLANELYRLEMPKEELPDWVCLALHESSFNTSAIHTNSDESKDWGLFQINDRYWCDPGDGRLSANSCNVSCSDLNSDDISKAVLCAKQIKEESEGFKPWVAWNNECQNNNTSLSDCFSDND